MIPAADALERLRDGNRRFVKGDIRNAGSIDRHRREQLVDGQSPFAVVLACSDSRVPVELIFDQELGELFVIRVAGNIATPSQIGSIEYAVTQLGSRLVVVLGHSNCGAVAATLESLANGAPMPSPNLEAIVEQIRPALESLRAESDDVSLEDAIVANARRAAESLAKDSEILGDLIASRNITVTSAEYSIETGEVAFFDK